MLLKGTAAFSRAVRLMSRRIPLIYVRRAALSEVCFLLAGKLKLACPPVGEVPPVLTDLSTRKQQSDCSGQFAEHDSSAALQQFLQLEGMTPARAAALHAFQIYGCAELNKTPIHDIFKVRIKQVCCLLRFISLTIKY